MIDIIQVRGTSIELTFCDACEKYIDVATEHYSRVTLHRPHYNDCGKVLEVCSDCMAYHAINMIERKSDRRVRGGGA